ncbi:MAG: glutathione S-transferase N-terminal domain-containing protein [Alphaproteobacteria bacterium]|nr:glutathione S-transferase N-terminal domain-containing protein [Alphaproteobacteria bacterium]MBU1516099.1 glutathione S-transferase N-terminal domain-containing protein [Alphaproteobacteria bacterium]MBU2092686.1 glutathione S-transferase N-terminal domain-containing protein [Alphaproteobacteria bacterium]MBU2153789.1 glutathione S-transferase N-terminal domain-containing protein [Alphaproteobacteria bacterium]MBU2308417.1 glutathione S-transferase N-terminal domain-containing protein [Alph
MITLYGGPTPNSRKVAIAMEEMGLTWRLHTIDILAGDQFAPDFLALNPNNKAPVIVDDEPTGGGEPFVLAESGAILWYLAEKTGRFLPVGARERAICHQWLMFQMSGIGPMFGQNAHFSFYAKDKHDYSIARYANEVTRLLRVLDGRLAETAFMAGADYTIADMATWPYVARQVDMRAAEFPNLKRWADLIATRPAVVRGVEVGRETLRKETIEGGLSGLSDDQRSILFGDRQYATR